MHVILFFVQVNVYVNEIFVHQFLIINKRFLNMVLRDYKPLLLLLICFLVTKSVAAQEFIDVTGDVKDEKTNLPLAGVTVSSSVSNTQTDEEGSFSLEAEIKEKLTFTFVGYNSIELDASQTHMEVSLSPSASDLDEVVVVGYGTQKKRNVTGAIVSVSSEDIAERQALNVFDALQGMTPGVQIAQESGRPGAESAVRIRSTATMEGGANPLYIVDGAQGVDISSINPDDIESVEILKDGASAAIYGSRSANGVIIITTKKAKAGQPQVKVNYLNSYSSLAHKVPQANADERRLYEHKRGGSDALSVDSLNPAFNADNDMQDLITQTAQRHQLDL